MIYVALLRGIGPGNPNMRNDKLRAVFEGRGLSGVRSVISSGNIIFESDRTDTHTLEDEIQKALQTELGIGGGTIIRSQQELERIVAVKPFGNQTHNKEHYQLVSFLKRPFDGTIPDSPYIVHATKTYICTTTDTTATRTPDVMLQLEKLFSKDITSRTMKTVERIIAKMDMQT